MKTVQEIDESMGYERGATRPRTDTSGCTYNPKQEDDPAHDCNVPARWHVKARSEDEPGWCSFLACDVHIGRILGGPYAESVVDRHEIGTACGLLDTWWIDTGDETGSFCCTEERGVELGYLRYDQG